ncbi:MAG: DNA polymerase III subunit delta' [Planctomycetales bacterium]
MIWEKIRGHADRVEMFRRSLARGRLAHAYLFAGPAGAGKRLFAHALAQCLFCERFADAELEACGECPACRMMAAGTHPDFHVVRLLSAKKELLIAQFAGEGETRGREGLCHDLSLRPMSASRRFAIIDDADRLRMESANALLKTLEEPPERAVIVLIAENAEALLPTVRSRCQLVRFAPLPDADVAELLLALEWVADRPEAESIAALCEGSLAMAEQLLDPALRRLRELVTQGLAARYVDSLRLASQAIAGLEEIGGDKPQLRRNAGWLVRFCLEFYRRAARDLAGAATAPGPAREFAARLDRHRPETVERVAEMFDRVAEAERQLDRAAPFQLCLESLFHDLSRLHATAEQR